MKLDTTKVYYLGDLSDEQLEELRKYLINNTIHAMVFLLDIELIKDKIYTKDFVLATNEYFKTWGLYSKDYYGREVVNALTLFDKNERIAQIQLRIQELNNELIDLDEEMRTLTYGKKEN